MVEAADMTQDVKAAHNALANHNEIDGSITAMFQQIGKGIVKYGHHQLTRAETQYNLYSYITNRYLIHRQCVVCALGHRKQPTLSNHQ